MGKVLFRFWLRRLVSTFLMAAVLLFLVNYYRYGISEPMLMETWFWAIFTGLVAASLATYWAYTRQCKVLKKNDPKE